MSTSESTSKSASMRILENFKITRENYEEATQSLVNLLDAAKDMAAQVLVEEHQEEILCRLGITEKVLSIEVSTSETYKSPGRQVEVEVVYQGSDGKLLQVSVELVYYYDEDGVEYSSSVLVNSKPIANREQAKKIGIEHLENLALVVAYMCQCAFFEAWSGCDSSIEEPYVEFEWDDDSDDEMDDDSDDEMDDF